MSAAARYRRTIVVDSSLVARNVAIVRERLGSGSFSLWSGRRSGERFLEGFAPIASAFEVDVVAGSEPAENEMRITQLLGGHPELFSAVSLETHLFTIRDVDAGQGVSYGATFVAPTDMPVGLAPIGFADGIDRRLSGHLRVRVNGVEVPVIGRIAMDSISIDLRDVPDAEPGSSVVVYGNTRHNEWGLRAAAEVLGILPVEIITRLSERSEVVWR